MNRFIAIVDDHTIRRVRREAFEEAARIVDGFGRSAVCPAVADRLRELAAAQCACDDRRLGLHDDDGLRNRQGRPGENK